MSRSLSRYLKIAFLNLLVVAFLGVLMRYKILYSLPFIDQKNLLHGHSHFAFSGWITQTLMVLLVAYLSKATGKDEFISYKKLLLANLITAYGMLIAFPIQGYGMVSIFFSTLSVFISYIFAFFFWKDLNKIENQNVAHYWFKAGLLLNVFSSIGTFGLAFMMANKIADQTWYLAAVYFYLHFQYNGWFFFTCMGLFYFILPTKIIATNKLKRIFWLFALASVPAYFLSTLWMSLPLWVYILVVLASFVQVIAWIVFVRVLFTSRNIIITTISKEVKWLFGLSAVALTIKLLLQLSSTIPYLSQLAFGFRSIVIAYLHLVLLGVITIFLLGYIFTLNVLTVKKTTVYGVIIFVIGIFLNELMLMLQGVASFSYTIIPYTNELLLSFALMMFSGIILLLVSQLRK
ncbi:MAG TPA: hypothetical protein PLX60_04520 [Chitinophagales bacterium]|jgi:hypothetical protein|nr:hypothetical protein [Chitinophagales bacterium]HPH87359.1 hypothetical protein [Chitinophagales bacterium]